jgi:hypothetical protein
LSQNSQNKSMNIKILISTISVISIILIGIISFATFNNKTNNTATQLTSSTVARSSLLTNSSQSSIAKSITTGSTLSSQQSEIKSSTLAVQSSIVQPVVTTPVCNLPESDNLVKTEDGCFELVWGFGDSDVFKSKDYVEEANNNLLFKSESNISLLKKLSMDYYKKIKNKFVSTDHKITFLGSQKKETKKFEIYLSIIDVQYFNGSLNNNPFALRLNSIYTIFEQSDGSWSYQFQEFVKDNNGKIINE